MDSTGKDSGVETESQHDHVHIYKVKKSLKIIHTIEVTSEASPSKL